MTIEVVSYYSSTNNNHGAIEKKKNICPFYLLHIHSLSSLFTFNLKANELVVCVCYLKRKVLKG